MTIRTLTTDTVRRMIGSDMTDSEARVFLARLRETPYQDTDDVPDREWLELLTQAWQLTA